MKQKEMSPPGDKPLTFVERLAAWILMFLPGVGLVFVFKWAFGKGINFHRRKIARIGLVISSFSLVIYYYVAKFMLTLHGH